LWGCGFVFYLRDPSTAQLDVRVRDDIAVLHDTLLGEIQISVSECVIR
jgi:hypothetical protein